jgi:hypothetical protein
MEKTILFGVIKCIVTFFSPS